MSEDLVRPVKTGMEENQIREMEEELRRFAPPDQEQEPPDDTLDPLVGPDQFEPSPIITDVARGITELPTQTLGGVRDATENTLQAVAGVGQFLNDTLGTGSQSWLVDEDAAQKFEEAVMEHRQAVTGEQGGEDEDFLPEVSEPASVTGGLIRSISQFATGFIPALRGIQRATGARASLSAGGIAQTEAAAGISGALVFDPHEQRLSDLIQSYPELENPITEALASDEDDSAIEGRFKNVLEGLGLGVGAQGLEIAARGLTKGVRAIKANRQEKGIEPTRTEQEITPEDLTTAQEAFSASQSQVNNPRTAPSIDEFPDTRGQGALYHGSSAGIERLDTEHFSEMNYYGQGFYTTDAADVAAGYAGFKRGNPGKIYRAVPRQEATRTLNMEKPLSDKFIREMDTPTGSETGAGDDLVGEAIEIVSTRETNPAGEFAEEAASDAANEVTLRDIMDEIRNMPEPAVRIQEAFESIRGFLEKRGYRSMHHTGGVLTGTKPHRTTIHFNPAEDLELREVDPSEFAGEVRRFDPTGDNEPLVQSLGDPNGELLTTDLTGSVGAARRPTAEEGETTVSELIGRGRKRQMPFKINWAVVSEPNGLEEVLQRTGSVFARRIDKARRGKMSDERLDELAQQQLDSLANETGLTPDDITRIHGEGLRAEQIHAMKWVLEDATATLQETAERAANSADPADMFAFKKMKEAHTAVFARLQGEVSEAGRSLRASRIPTGSKEKQIADLSAAVSGGIGEGPESMRRLARAIAEVDDAETINKALKPGIGKRTNDAIVDLMYFNLLSGPKTHVINMVGSGSNLAWQIGERAMAARLARAGSRTDGVELGEASEMLYGLVQSFGPALKAAGRSFKTGEFTDPLGKVEGRRLVSITPENFPIGKGVEKVFSKFSPEGARVSGQVVNKGIEGLGQIVSLTSRALMSQDEFWKTMAQTAEMNARALRTAKQEGLTGEASLNRMQEILENPSTVDLEAGQNFGRDITFTRELGEFGSRIQRLANHNLGTRFFVPFPRVVGNLLKWAGTRSLFAPIAQNVRRELKSGGPERDIALARMGMGTMLGMFAVDMALRGKITGAAPYDDELRSTWLREHQEFSIKIGDEWWGYNRADPFGLIIGPAASYAQLAGELTPEEREDYVGAFLLATSESILNKTWLRSVTEGLEAVTAPDRSLEKFQETAAGLLVPTGVAQVTQAIDPVWREVNGATESILNRVPGYSSELPARRNVWGEKMLSQHGWGGQDMDIVPHDGELEEPGSDLSMQDFMPFSRFTPQKHPINLWMYENRVGLDRPKETQAGAELTPEQYSRFVELQGNVVKDPTTGLGLRDTMNALIEGNHPRSAAWRNATGGPKGGKSKIFKRYVRVFRSLARAQLAEEYPDFKQRVEAAQMESNEALMRTIMNPDAGEVQE